MAALNTFVCDVCGRQRQSSNHWLLCRVADQGPSFPVRHFVSSLWDDDAAHLPTVRHVCGAEHATVLYGRFLSTGSIDES